MTEEELERKVAAAIMRAFFNRPIELQVINVDVNDQIDLAKAAIQCIAENDPCR